MTLAPAATVAFFSSTKLPTLVPSASSVPGRIRANGPMLAPAPMIAPSICEKAWIVAPCADRDAGAEHDMRLDRDVAAEPGVEREPHAFGVDQGRAFLEHLLAPAALPFELEVGELGAAVDPRGLIGIALDHHRLAALRRRRC